MPVEQRVEVISTPIGVEVPFKVGDVLTVAEFKNGRTRVFIYDTKNRLTTMNVPNKHLKMYED